jgi:hypothetical protein
MESALESNEFVIIQIDIDVCEEYGVPRRRNGTDISASQLCEEVIQKLINEIGLILYSKFSSKIIFALCYNSIECWFLPLLFEDGRKNKFINCCDTINQQLKDFTIDCENKSTIFHEKLCRKYLKNKSHLDRMAEHQFSLKHFIDQLPGIPINVDQSSNYVL